MARLVGVLVLCLAVAIFAVQNDEVVRLAFLGMNAPRVQLSYVILGAVLLGALGGALAAGTQVLRLRRRVHELEREAETMRGTGSGMGVRSVGSPAESHTDLAPSTEGSLSTESEAATLDPAKDHSSGAPEGALGFSGDPDVDARRRS